MSTPLKNIFGTLTSLIKLPAADPQPETQHECKAPSDIERMVPELPGGWFKIEDYAPLEHKIYNWIRLAVKQKHIYHDNNDYIKIQEVYSQVVSGVNYWIKFSIMPTGESYWIKVYEPLSTAGTNGKTAPVVIDEFQVC